MNQGTLNIVLLAIPLLVGGMVAAINSTGVNATTEKLEGFARARYQRTSVSSGWFSKYIINPVLWAVVKFCDWTDGFRHRGVKNGARIGATLYLIATWLFLLYVAISIVLIIAVSIAILYIALAVMGGSNTTRRDSSGPVGERGILQSGHSEQKEKFFGGTYTQYYDEHGNEVATAEVKEKLFGGEFVQYFDRDGTEIGTGELKEKFFGGKYVQQYGADGNETGTSESREKFFGGKYTQHYDTDGSESGTSEKKEKFFGGEYTEHKRKQ